MRRISGHLRRDGKLWTFLYFNDPYVDLDAAQYIEDVPGRVQSPPEHWITEFIHEGMHVALLKDLSMDGFGLVLRVLREIKSTWKLLISQMEDFLEALVSIQADPSAPCSLMFE